MEVADDNLRKCLDEATKIFSSKFGCQPDIAVSAPGRVNLIGEHTDYNDGFVLPMALPLMTVIVGQKSKSDTCTVVSTSIEEADGPCQVFPVPEHPGDAKEVPVTGPAWIRYVKGVVALMNTNGDVPAFDAVITTCVPLGGGVSSSAALEVAVGLFVEQLTGKELPRVKLALLCQAAEHRYAGNKCGIMDQFVCVMAQEGSALLIDCRDRSCRNIPLQDPNLAILVTDSCYKHELSVEGEYNQRRASCESAAKKLNVASLRSATLEQLKKDGPQVLDTVEFQRARHVVSEITRTEQAVEALQEGNYTLFGQLMNESHASLKDDYEVSCGPLDELVELARQDERIYGSRMTGGGFGGCTVTLLHRDAVSDTIQRIKEKYSGKKVVFYVTTASSGARVITI